MEAILDSLVEDLHSPDRDVAHDAVADTLAWFVQPCPGRAAPMLLARLLRGIAAGRAPTADVADMIFELGLGVSPEEEKVFFEGAALSVTAHCRQLLGAHLDALSPYEMDENPDLAANIRDILEMWPVMRDRRAG